MLPSSHHGRWAGENRLWLEPGSPVHRSEGALELASDRLSYTWAWKGEPQRGTLQVSGPSGALAGAWQDSWHAKGGFTFHGFWADRLLRLWGTYPAGEGPDWGWRIELDLREPDALTLLMFNVPPDPGTSPYAGPELMAVHLRGARVDAG